MMFWKRLKIENNIYRIYFNTTPISEEERKAGFGGVNRYKDLQGFNNSELIGKHDKTCGYFNERIGNSVEIVG